MCGFPAVPLRAATKEGGPKRGGGGADANKKIPWGARAITRAIGVGRRHGLPLLPDTSMAGRQPFPEVSDEKPR